MPPIVRTIPTTRPCVHGSTSSLASDERFAVPDGVWGSFVRIATNRLIFPVPTPLGDAFSFLHAVRAQSNHVAVAPGTRHLEIFERLCHEGEAFGDLAADAFLAAIAVEQGATLASLDRDFARFPVCPGARR